MVLKYKLNIKIQYKYRFKAKNSKISTAPLCLGNISKDFLVDMMKQTGLYG